MSVAIVDYGCANIASVKFALERLGASVVVTSDTRTIARAEGVILPGVGAFDYAMTALKKRELITTLKALSQPVLGICLGMQLLFSGSSEGTAPGLGIFEGSAVKFPPAPERPVPHMGWNRLALARDDALFSGLESGAQVYFAHSYYIAPQGSAFALSDYGGPLAAAVRKSNFRGCQFHPERSGDVGARILKNFLELSC